MMMMVCWLYIQHGDVWMLDVCTHCHCNDAVTYCRVQRCHAHAHCPQVSRTFSLSVCLSVCLSCCLCTTEYTFHRQLKTWFFKKSFPDIIIWYWLHLDCYLRLVCSNFETVLPFKVYDMIWYDSIMVTTTVTFSLIWLLAWYCRPSVCLWRCALWLNNTSYIKSVWPINRSAVLKTRFYNSTFNHLHVPILKLDDVWLS